MTKVRVTMRDLRRVNRAAVLRPLFLDGPLSRVRLAQLTGLSSGSVTNVVSDLLEEGLVVEVGTVESEGGRPSVLLQVNPEFGVVIGIDIGETGIRIESFDLGMRELSGTTLPLHPQDVPAAEAVEPIAVELEALRSKLERDGRRVLGVGVAVPGVVAHGAEVLVHAPNIGWEALPLADLLRRRVNLPVFVENGAKTLGQAEMWLGAGRGAQHAVVILWGTGVGAGVFTNGSLYRGVASSAGEWGHMCISVGGTRCRCGGAGCLEAYVGADALITALTDAGLEAPATGDQEEQISRLLALAPASKAATEVLDRVAEYFGVAVANLANLFNPELVVVGGWLGLQVGPLLLPKIREATAAQALSYAVAGLRIELGNLGVDAVALGAAMPVVEALLTSGGQVPEASAAFPRIADILRSA